jgi:dihydrodipicolinate synthase/N-acetylneuraminate lyase
MSNTTTAKYLVGTLEELQEIDTRINEGMRLQDSTYNADHYAYMYPHGSKYRMIIETDDPRNPLQFLTENEIKKLKTHKQMKDEGGDV